ncbi:MAG: hypothetical protein KGM49_07770 [Sphingomonadales bacterium]|nr:hypothetical protein [Sphingomonadales bacterium]
MPNSQILSPAGFVPSRAVAFANVDGSAMVVSASNPLPVTTLSSASVTPLAGSATASVVLGPFQPIAGRAVILALSGTWTGTAKVTRSTDGGTTRLPLSVAGSAFFAVPVPAVGQPNVCIENCLVDATGASEESIQFASGDVLTLRNIEFLNGAAPIGVMQISSTAAVTLMDCKSENYNVGASGGQIFKFSQCNVRAITASVNGVLGSGGASYFLFGNSGTTITIHGLTVNDALTGGTLYGYTADTSVPIVADVKVVGTRSSDDVFPSTGCAPKFDADRRQKDRVTDLGDANVTLTSISTRIQYLNTTLTANRTITLPNSGIYEGMEFEIVRKLASPGAFTFQVVDPVGGNNYTFAASANGSVCYRYHGGWRLMRACAL